MVKFPTGCQMVSVNILVPYEKNPKNHTDKDIDLIIRSINRNGWGEPLLVCPETKEVLSGNGRLMAAKKLGLEEVPVVYVPNGLTEKQKADLVIASNKLVEVSGYNDNLDALVAEFDLDIGDFGMVAPDMEISDEPDDDEPKTVKKHLLQCPQCGFVNEEKAFKNYENTDQDI